MSAGGTARTVVLSSAGTYDKQTGVKYKWSNMVHWTEIKDVAMTHPQATRFIGNTKGKAKGKGGAKGKKSKKGKPKDYDKDLFSSSKDKDMFDPEKGVGAAIALPNVLTLPGFLVATLMGTTFGRTWRTRSPYKQHLEALQRPERRKVLKPFLSQPNR
jgi:hypothetical protein